MPLKRPTISALTSGAVDTGRYALLQHMPGFVGVLAGPTHIFEYVNEAYMAIAGARQFVGRSVREVFPELNGQGIFGLLDRVYASGEPLSIKSMPIRLTGEDADRFIDFIYQPIRDDQGSVTGIFVGGYDTTEHVRTLLEKVEALRYRDALASYAERVSALTDPNEITFIASEILGKTLKVSRVGYGTIDPVAETLHVERDWTAPGVESLAGTLPLRAYGSFIDSLKLGEFISIADVDLDERTASAADALKGRSAHSFLNVPVLEQGQLVAVLFVNHSAIRVWTPEDNAFIKEMAVRARNAAERNRNEETLRTLNATLQERVEAREATLKDTQDFARLALSAVGGVGVWTYEVATDLFHYDEAIATIYGIDPAKGSVGIPRLEFLRNVVAEDRKALTATMSGGLTKPGDLELEYRIRHPDGSIRWVLSRGHTYHDEGGKPVRRTGVGVETTTQRVTEEALRQAQKMEAVGQLTGGVAHDFNNLLMVIKASSDMLRRPALSEERRSRYIKAISDTVDRAAKLTGQLLAFARRQALQPEIFSVGDSVNALGEMLGTLTGQRIKIVTSLPEEACWINADPSQFDTAIVNMAVNARDAMSGEGQLSISVATVEAVPPIRSHPAVVGPYVAVSVSDSGSGIPPEQLEIIFEPFFTTKGVGHGTGLGLSQVFGFAKQSGGEIAVVSEVGKGTTFTLYLPRVAEGNRMSEVSEEPEPLPEGHGTCVLVVEDNSDIGIFATQALAELGYLTVLAGNAKEALTELEDNPDRFDVVFTDIVMPGMGGIELAKLIRRQHRDLPVVLTSGYSHALAESGTDGFELLQKPYSIEQLSRVLRKVARSQSRRLAVGRKLGINQGAARALASHS